MGRKRAMPAWVALPPIFCGSSRITMGLLAAITSMGRRLANSSRSEYMMRASLERPPSFMDVLNACMLMTMTLISELAEKRSMSPRRLLL